MPKTPSKKPFSSPKNWETVWDKIQEFRKANPADVDGMGCCSLAEKHQPEAVQRYQILTSLQLSSQTKDPVTAAAIKQLQADKNGGLTPVNIARMDPKKLDAYIGKVGFHNRKTIYLQKTAQILLDKYDGDIPPTLEEMLTLPGFGPKMSYLLMQEAWGKSDGIGVDTHVHRIANRLGWVKKTKGPEDTRAELEDWLPRDRWMPVNVLLVGFGQTLCKPLGPRCYECPIRDLCPKIGAKPSPKKKAPVAVQLDTDDDDGIAIAPSDVSFAVWRRAFSQYQDSLSKFQPERDWLLAPPALEKEAGMKPSSSIKIPGPAEMMLLDEGTKHPSFYMNREGEVLGEANEKILHFMQISDLHVSMFSKKGGLAHLEAVLYNEIPLVAPELVLATGDLTDGKAIHFLTSLQQEKEWNAYFNLLKESRVMERSGGNFYLDQRGNHDCWNVADFTSAFNYFKGLSAVKKEGYAYTLEKAWGKYTFVALDGCPKTGPGRPFNFFGYLDTSDMDFLANTLIKSIKERHNHTFGMSHYPTGTTLFGKTKNGIGFWDLTQHVSIWLCGHLHKLAGGLGDQMYAFQDNKVLELELGDMKSHGMFRIIAVDHDLVSFVDVPLYQESRNGKLPLPIDQSYKSFSSRPPIVLVTNPKDARYMIPGKEPVSLIRDSSHIRVLIWATTTSEKDAGGLAKVSCIIDGKELEDSVPSFHGRGKRWSNITNLKDTNTHVPLWTIPWNTSVYDDDEIHILSVVAVDHNGLQGNHTVRFRVNGKRIEKMDSGPGGFIISLPLGLLFKDLFLVTYLFVVIGFLLLPKIFVLLCQGLGIYDEWVQSTSETLVAIDTESQRYWLQVRPPFKVRVRHRWSDFKFTMVATFLRFCEFSKLPDLFYPLYGFALYVTVGPWFVGDFVPSTDATLGYGKRWGWLMTYGVWFMDGSYEPILDTWVYAWYGLLYTLFPLLFYLSFCVLSPQLLYSSSNPRLTDPIHMRKSIRYIVISVLVYHAIDTASMTIFYGLVSTLVSPGKTWILVWAYFKLGSFGVFDEKSAPADSVMEGKQD